ncbi:MAG TPA: nicotinamide riboside transporter PnuC [Woeseiaceae bacterium]|nr:nicotinamide riboside transporter PnuC [Woeseiaceae bacterium]
MSLAATVLEQAKAQSIPEIVAVAAAIAYLVLAIRQNIACWIFAAISTSIYVWLFIGAKLYMEAALNGFYLLMAVYGWLAWRTGAKGEQNRPVVSWPIRIHLRAGASFALLSVLTGFVLHRYTDAAFPYVDSLTTWFAIWSTFLVAKKVLENWWYWLLIDLASVFIYWSRDLQLTGILFLVYIAMIPFGLVAWTQSMRQQEV